MTVLAGPRWPVAVAAYVALCCAPMLVALAGPAPVPRGFWVELGVGLGFAAVGMVALQFALTARVARLSRALGQDTLLHFHKFAGFAGAALALAHPIVLIAVEPAYAAFFDPRVNAMRALALGAATGAIAGLLLMTALRARLGLSYEWWRLTHGLLGAIIMIVALAHVLKIRHHVASGAQAAAFAALVAAPLGLLVHVRVLRPLLNRRRTWSVDAVRKEQERVWTVELGALGHDGLRFEPGQFAWITFGGPPLRLRQHPFTIASSAECPGRLLFTIKELGDFTSTIGSLERGTIARIEGPAGSFVVPPSARGIAFVAGGIGITPAMSILRTWRDRKDPRPATLIYAADTLEKATFAEELRSLGAELRLRIVHVPERPPPGWEGHSGYVTREMLAALLGEEELREREFMICGPDPMMDAVELALLELGVPRGRVRSERFNTLPGGGAA